MRQKIITDLFQSVDRVSKSPPATLALTFAREPRSLAEPAPDPEQITYIGVYNWLAEQQRYIVEELTPIGDQSADNRRLALLGKLNGVLKRLEGRKQRAWSRHVAEWFVRARLEGKDGAPFARGGQCRSCR